MTIAELTRAMEDVEMYKKTVESLEQSNKDLRTQLDTKHSVNHELGQILEGKIKEYNKNKAEVKLATSLGSLKSYQLYAAVSVISEYYELLAPLIESKSKEAFKDLKYVRNLNFGIPPSNIPLGMLEASTTLLRQQIYFESQQLQKAIKELHSSSSSSTHIQDTLPQHDSSTSVWRIEPPKSVPTLSSSSQEPPQLHKTTKGNKKARAPKRIVAANQIAPGVQRSGVKAPQQKQLSRSSSTSSENSPTEPPSEIPTLPIVTPPENPSSVPTTPIVAPSAVTPTTPLPPNISTAMLLQMHKEQMLEKQQGLNVPTPPSTSTSPHASADVLEPIAIPDTESPVSEATTLLTQGNVDMVEVASTTNPQPEEANTLATIASSHEVIDLDSEALARLEGSVLEKFRAMDMKRSERWSVVNEKGDIEDVGNPATTPTTTSSSSGTFSFAADLTHIPLPDMAQTTTLAKTRQSPGYVSGKKRLVDDSPTRLSSSSSLSVAKRPKFPAFELPASFKTKESLSSPPGFRREKGRWYLEAVEVPLWKGRQEEEIQ